MSNWYVRRSRERFWAKGMEQDKINAYMTLYTALVQIVKAAAPMIPFMADEIYRNLVCSVDKKAPVSVHLCDFPTVNERYTDSLLEESMQEVLDIVVMGRACRNASNIKNRQPLSRILVRSDVMLSEYFTEIIRDELNIKELEYAEDVREYTSYIFKPQLKTVGPKYGRQLGAIREHLSALDGNSAMDELDREGALRFEAGGPVELTRDDLLIEMVQKEGYVSQADKGKTVVLDIGLTDELINEGYVLEVISKVQTMRKEINFEVTDRIDLSFAGDGELIEVIKENEKAIAVKVLAASVKYGETAGESRDWSINGKAVTIGVKKA
jgi:isoleucyl-tRNA synthetase